LDKNSFSANSPRPTAPLDMIKFLCKDLWMLVFRKQIDNLKTNHRGTFVLTDSRFQPLSRMSVDRGRGARGLDDALNKAQAVSVDSSFALLKEKALLFVMKDVWRAVLRERGG
jgi:hypothetical protein